MNGVCNVKNFFGSTTWGPGEGSKGQISFNLIQLQSQFQRFLFQTLCVYSQMKDQNISDWIFILSWDLGVLMGQNQIPSCCPLCYLLLNYWTKFNQICCVGYSHEWSVHFFCPAPWGPGEGSKDQISFNFNYKVNFKDFYTKLCVCTHK